MFLWFTTKIERLAVLCQDLAQKLLVRQQRIRWLPPFPIARSISALLAPQQQRELIHTLRHLLRDPHLTKLRRSNQAPMLQPIRDTHEVGSTTRLLQAPGRGIGIVPRDTGSVVGPEYLVSMTRTMRSLCNIESERIEKTRVYDGYHRIKKNSAKLSV